MRNKHLIFVSQKLGLHVLRRRKGEKEKKKKKKKKKEKKGKNFRYGIMCILDSRVLVWRLVAPFSRVLWRDHINPIIVEVKWVKP